MTLFEIILISIGLAMDSFAVSICKGLSMKYFDLKKAKTIAGYFGFFQGFMPLIGFLLGFSFEELVTNIDHWIAFILLGLIGGKMIIESFQNDTNNINDSVDFKNMIILSIATSIDALAIGITFAFFNINIIYSIICIGIITFAISLLGVKIGNLFGNKYEKKSEFLGGFILVSIGIKILLQHLNII